MILLKFYEVRSERWDFNWCWFWTQKMFFNFLEISNPRTPHSFSVWLWPYCVVVLAKLNTIKSLFETSKSKWHCLDHQHQIRNHWDTFLAVNFAEKKSTDNFKLRHVTFGALVDANVTKTVANMGLYQDVLVKLF